MLADLIFYKFLKYDRKSKTGFYFNAFYQLLLGKAYSLLFLPTLFKCNSKSYKNIKMHYFKQPNDMMEQV